MINTEKLDNITNARLNDWKTAAHAELQDLVLHASTARKQMAAAKTATKRAYFERKIQKLQPRVIQMLTALERFKALEQAPSPDVSESSS